MNETQTKLTKSQRHTIAKYDPTHGTPLWAANRFRSDVFPHLLDDLLVAEQNGLPLGVCPKLQIALGEIVNAATEFPDGSFWRSSVLGHVQKLENLYREWNDVLGEDETAIYTRRRKLNQMRNRRHKLSTAMRQNQAALAKQLDLKLMEAMFEALGDLTKALPSIFMNLAKAIGRFHAGAQLHTGKVL